MKCVIASSRGDFDALAAKLKAEFGCEVFQINKKEGLCIDVLREIDPTYIFFPHWSYIISDEIFNIYECIIFHMTDVPFGRGGSPLQNLIYRKIYETKISALRCSKELDAGPVYLKRPLSLFGTAEEIYTRAAETVGDMIIEMVETSPFPQVQTGEPTVFKRRKPADSDISKVDNLQQVFDYIRMLDADGYPRAFFETKYLRFEFERASLKNGEIRADVRIILKNEE